MTIHTLLALGLFAISQTAIAALTLQPLSSVLIYPQHTYAAQVVSPNDTTISAQLKDFSVPMAADGAPDPAAATTDTQIFSGTAQLNDTDINTVSNANTAIQRLDAALGKITDERATYGSVINRLTYAGDNLTNVAQNTTESRSRIMDTDYAKASSELARSQIISQAATAMLAQANQSPQSVLKLLQG
jgi:flagellin-like hook-associated protein FlgL